MFLLSLCSFLCLLPVALFTVHSFSLIILPHTLKTTGLFQPNFMANMDKLSSWITFLNNIFTQRLGLSIFDPKIGLKQPSIF